MPKEVVESHEALGVGLRFLYTKWTYYRRLFCTDDRTVKLLHYAAGLFFDICRETLRDDMILSLCRLTDPAISKVKGQEKPNFTVRYFVSLIPYSESSLKQALNAHLTELDSRSQKFRQHRNRRIGHYDLGTKARQSNALLPDIDLDDMDGALLVIADILNTVEQHYDNNQHSYADGIYGAGNADDLVDFMERQIELEKYYNQKEFGDCDYDVS